MAKANETTDKKRLCCEICGETDEIQTKAWVNANDNTYVNDASDGDSDDNWCESCGHVHFTTVESYLAANK